jgi:hypothetical protein
MYLKINSSDIIRLYKLLLSCLTLQWLRKTR